MLNNYAKSNLELGVIKECTRHAKDTSTLNIQSIRISFWEELERLNRKKEKGLDIYIDLPYQLLFSFE